MASVPAGILPGLGWFIYAAPAIVLSVLVMMLLGYWWSRGGDE